MHSESEESKYFLSIINSIHYADNTFTFWYSDEKIVLGAILHDNLVAQNFFAYATIYNTIRDIDAKIKVSLRRAIQYADEIDFEKWNPLMPPSENEGISIYYTENAIFRMKILWDLLAQLFNIKEEMNIPIEKVYASKIFHNAQQGATSNPFANKVYSYMKQAENTDIEPWEGNFAFVKQFRDKMTHRNSPNISTISNFDVELRMPMIYVLKRVIEDYKQVSIFIAEMVSVILVQYEALDQAPLLPDLNAST